LVVASAAAAQTAPKTDDVDVVPANDIVVTGVRGQPRSAVDSPTPIDTIGAAELVKTGRSGVLAALNNLVPSFVVPGRAATGQTLAISSGGLRTLNPDQTLVLVNGTRRHNTAQVTIGNRLFSGSAPVDLDLIPTSQIARIEVLRDGAAAQYGSDAVAGVVNIILKEDDGGFVSSSYGQNFDRSDGKLYQVNGSYGSKFADDRGYFNLAFTYKDQHQSNRADPVPATQQLYPLVNGQRDPRELTADRLVTKNYGVMPIQGANIGNNVKYDIGGAELYTFGTVSYRKVDVLYTFQFPNAVNTLPQFYPNGFIATRDINETDFQQAAGIRGDLGSWSYDLSSTVGNNHVKDSTHNNLNPSMGLSSPTAFLLGTLNSGIWVTSLDLAREVEVDGLGTIQLAAGAQDRVERYQIKAGDPSSYINGGYVIPAGQPFAGQRPTPGAVQLPGYQPVNAGTWKRNVIAAYGEIDWKPSDKVFLGLATRYERYNDSSGDSLVYQLTGRYEFTDWVALRGSIGTGFHAPSLALQHYSNNATQFATDGSGTIRQTVLPAPDTTLAGILGAKPLTPEKSKNYSAGLTFKPSSRMNITIDAYQISLKDRIFQSGLITGAAVNTILVANGQQANQSVSYFINGANTRTRGIDVVITDTEDLGDYGRLRLSAAYGYNKTILKSVIANPPELNALGSSYILLDALTIGYLTRTIPHHKASASANWALEKFDLNVRENWHGPFTVVNNNAALTRDFKGKFTTDVELTYSLTDTLSITAGANNLFNQYPSRNGVANATLGAAFYGEPDPIGFQGGSWYLRVQKNF
jgi:iron complex outermembrane receptor protein